MDIQIVMSWRHLRGGIIGGVKYDRMVARGQVGGQEGFCIGSRTRRNITQEEMDMSEQYGIKVGETVPDFKIETYEPSKGDFGEISLAALKANKRWTVLFFYPADFTFV